MDILKNLTATRLKSLIHVSLDKLTLEELADIGSLVFSTMNHNDAIVDVVRDLDTGYFNIIQKEDKK